MLRTQASSDYGFSVNIGFLSCGHLSLAVFLAALLITLWAWMQWGWPLVPAFCFLPLYLHIISWVKERSLALHCTAPNWTELHCTALHCIALQYSAQHCNALEFTSMHFTKRYCNAQHYTKLNWTELNWTELNCTALNCTELNQTPLPWTALHCTELHWNALKHEWLHYFGPVCHYIDLNQREQVKLKKFSLNFGFILNRSDSPHPPFLNMSKFILVFFLLFYNGFPND